MTRRVRLFSGIVMLAYVTMHLLNHAVGLVSLPAMEAAPWLLLSGGTIVAVVIIFNLLGDRIRDPERNGGVA